jgi:tripartite-type tricarboxylate transporter receptor subunit TctC
MLALMAGGAALGANWRTWAQQPGDYPDRAIRLVVPFPAGGAADNLARPLAQQLAHAFGQSVFVDNRGGANTMIGLEYVSKAPADGYTILLANEAGLSLAPAVEPIMKVAVPYDAAADFAPISVLGQYGSVLSVSPALPVRTLSEFVAYARKNPRKLNYASVGVGSQPHMMMEILKRQAGIDMVHVPYKGVAPALVDLIANHVQALISAPSGPTPYISDGRLRGLAYSGAKRLPTLPNVPTFAQAGMPDFEARGWFGIVAQAHTPDPIKARLRQAIWSIVQSQQYQSVAILANGYEVPAVDPAQFPAFLADDMRKWKTAVASLREQLV